MLINIKVKQHQQQNQHQLQGTLFFMSFIFFNSITVKYFLKIFCNKIQIFKHLSILSSIISPESQKALWYTLPHFACRAWFFSKRNICCWFWKELETSISENWPLKVIHYCHSMRRKVLSRSDSSSYPGFISHLVNSFALTQVGTSLSWDLQGY